MLNNSFIYWADRGPQSFSYGSKKNMMPVAKQTGLQALSHRQHQSDYNASLSV